jgi:type VI secretion system protein ImpJ
MSNHKVIWSEGMFLQPQHFQQQDKYIEYLLRQTNKDLHSCAWGFSELKIDSHLLELGKIAIKTCRGIFPDGTLFDVRENDAAPIPLEIPANTSNCNIYLALALRNNATQEIGHNNEHNKYRYQADSIELTDNNSINQQTNTQIQIAKLNLRLMLATDDCANYTNLAIARIQTVCPDLVITLDEQFIPPCIDIQATSTLPQFLQELLGLLRQRARSLATRIDLAGQENAATMTELMLLQLVNRFEPLVIHLTSVRKLHPLPLYKTLIQLMGELATFTREQHRPINLPVYLHDNLQQTYTPLIKELRRSLSTVLAQNAFAIPLELQENGIYIASITDKNLIDNATFVLAIHADMPTKDLQTNFPTQIKIAPIEQIHTLITRALPGIDLQPLAVAPRQIPYHTNFIYFTINKKHQFWSALSTSNNIAMHLSNNFPGLKLEFWAIKEYIPKTI